MQWVWENKEAFGNNTPTEIISGFKFNLRFPGQYFDNETNLNYNIHRDYNPVWGRYITSDPSDDSRQYAQKLANILNANVRAPNKFIWYYADGKISINSSYMVNGAVRINEKDPGKFNVFYPKK